MFQKEMFLIHKSYVFFSQILMCVLFIFSIFCSSLQAESHLKDVSTLIHLRHHSFDPIVSIPQTSRSFSLPSKSLSKIANRYFIVQFHGPVIKSDLKRLSEMGISIFDYIPNNSFIVRTSETLIKNIQKDQRVRWIGPFAAQFRVAMDVMEQVATLSPKKSVHKTLMLRVTIFPGENLDEILNKISTLGTIINKHTTQWKTSVQLKISPVNIPMLSKIQGIQWISMFPKWQLMNNVASNIVNVHQPRNQFNLYGKGQVVAVCDTGLDQGETAPEFLHDDFEDGNGQSRVKKLFNLTPSFMFNDSADDIFSGHGTHVAGTILGNGYHSGSQPQLDYYPESAYVGIAPKASLVFQAAEDSTTGMLLGLMLDLSQIFAQAYYADARIHSNSWGAASASTYSAESTDVDQFMWEYKDFLIVFAAGNSGVDMDHDGRIDPYSICSPSTSKNCLTVGGSESVRTNEGYTCTWGDCWSDLYAKDPIASDFLSDNQDGMAAFSSRGPTIDGRYKPDIVAPSTNILSTRSSKSTYDGWGLIPNQHYLYMGGTSMATPIVAGTAVLMREYLIKIGMTDLSSALIKAALINAADNMNQGQYNKVSDFEIPDITPNNVNGWGRVNLGNGVYPETPKAIIYKDDDTLETNGIHDYFFEVTDSSNPLKVNLVWTDFPGSPVAQGGLVNDLDLHMIGPNKQIHYPDGAMNQSFVQTYQYDMNFPIFQTDINQCGMRFTPEKGPCFLDAISISIANPKNFQDDIWIRVYELNDDNKNSEQLRYEKKYQYLPSGWTTLPIDHVEFQSNDFLITIEKTNPNIQIFSDIFSDSDRGMTRQYGQWKSSNETFYIRAHVRYQNHATPYDRVNNCLGISLDQPQKGIYHVQVLGHNIPKGPQPFALVASGNIEESPPSISYTQIPETGNRIKNLKGKINYQGIGLPGITVYIYHNNQWHLKAAALPVSIGGSFEVDITTRYGDHMATSIAVFVVSKSTPVQWPESLVQLPDRWKDISLISDVI
ncbi:subtilisin-like serine protease, partial [Candidatus Magnetomorum sp. HK-1]